MSNQDWWPNLADRRDLAATACPSYAQARRRSFPKAAAQATDHRAGRFAARSSPRRRVQRRCSTPRWPSCVPASA